MKKILIFLWLVMTLFGVKAQSGSTCSTSKLATADTCINNDTLSGAEMWLKFTATKTAEQIFLRKAAYSLDHMDKMDLLAGSCSSYSTLYSVVADSTNDTLLQINAVSLTIGTTYYIRTTRTSTVHDAIFNVCLRSPDTEILGICSTYGTNPPHCCSGFGPCILATVCVGSDLTLEASLASGPVYNSTWEFHGYVPDVSTPGPVLTMTFATVGTIDLTVTSLNYNGQYVQSNDYQIIVIDNPYPPASFTPSPNPGCIDQLICMDNTTPEPYNAAAYATWDFGNGVIHDPSCTLGTCNCSSYSASGTYTVTLTVADPSLSCPVVTATNTVTILDPGIGISAETVCLGSPTSYSAIPICLNPADIATYNWTFGDGGTSTLANPTHTYATSGTFPVTLSVTDVSGNTYTATGSAFVAPLPPLPVVTGTGTVCDTGVPITYTITNYSGAYVYSPVITGGTGTASTVNSSGVFTVTWSTTSGDQITLHVSDPKGCSNVLVIDIPPCCAPADPSIHNFSNTDVSAITAIPGFSTTATVGGITTVTVTGKTFYINGTFTDNQNLVFSNCTVYLGKDAVINVATTKTFRIEGNSILRAGCGIMWDGIYLPDNSALLQVKVSVIQDAKNAVVSNNGGNYQIEASTLNKNYKSIVVNAYTAHHAGLIGSSKVSCVPSATSPGTLLLPPYNTERSPVGIEINRVTNALPILVGETDQSNNTFDNLDIGVMCNRSNVLIRNNTFQNIQTAGAQVATAAIYANGNPFFPLLHPIYNITVGGYGANDPNTFTNCLTGVYTTTNLNVNVYANTFYRITQYGVHCQAGNLGNTINIKNNTINSAKVAIHCFQNSNCTTEISLNKISVNALNAILLGTTYGIDLQEFSSAGVNSHYTVFDNKIQNVRNGIRANNLNHAIIDNNKIELRPTGTSATVPAKGIEILANSLTQVTASDIQSIPVSSALWVGGIDASLSPNSYIGCNTLYNMGYAIQCEGAMHTSTVFNNGMNTCTRGIWLSNGGIIDQQGNATHPTYNKWGGTFTDQTYTSGPILTNGTLSPFYVKNVPAYFHPTLNNVQAGFGIAIPINLATGPLFAPPCTIYPAPALMALREQVAQNLISFTTPEAKWLSQRSVYAELLNDSTLLSDPTLGHFKDSVDASAMGKLVTVNKALTNGELAATPGDLLSAVSNNNSVIVSIGMENTSQTVNNMVLNNMQSGQTAFDASQLATLRSIANECPFTYGDAVYEARMLLQPYDSIGTVYLNPCEEQSRSLMVQSQDDNSKAISLYPNPNKGSMTLTYQLNETDKGEMVIFDLEGRKLHSYSLNANENSTIIEENSLSNGVYLYKVYINDKAVKTDRIIIIK